jgi:ZIP family zinc transporter
MRSSSFSLLSRSLDFVLYSLLLLLFLFALLLGLLFPSFFFPYCLALLSGFSTLAGGFLVVSRSSPINSSTLGFACGLAAGVMGFVGALDFFIIPIINQSISLISALASFIMGSLLMLLALNYIPDPQFFHVGKWASDQNEAINDEEADRVDSPVDSTSFSRVLRFSVLSSSVLAFHNCPEGLAVFISSVESTSRGLRTALAIALHNGPEGLIVATPIYFITKDRSFALKVTALSGLTEPIGALLSFFLSSLSFQLTEGRVAIALCFVGGLMITVSIKELIPEGIQFNGVRTLCKGAAFGVSIMALSNLIT